MLEFLDPAKHGPLFAMAVARGSAHRESGLVAQVLEPSPAGGGREETCTAARTARISTVPDIIVRTM